MVNPNSSRTRMQGEYKRWIQKPLLVSIQHRPANRRRWADKADLVPTAPSNRPAPRYSAAVPSSPALALRRRPLPDGERAFGDSSQRRTRENARSFRWRDRSADCCAATSRRVHRVRFYRVPFHRRLARRDALPTAAPSPDVRAEPSANPRPSTLLHFVLEVGADMPVDAEAS